MIPVLQQKKQPKREKDYEKKKWPVDQIVPCEASDSLNLRLAVGSGWYGGRTALGCLVSRYDMVLTAGQFATLQILPGLNKYLAASIDGGNLNFGYSQKGSVFAEQVWNYRPTVMTVCVEISATQMDSQSIDWGLCCGGPLIITGNTPNFTRLGELFDFAGSVRCTGFMPGTGLPIRTGIIQCFPAYTMPYNCLQSGYNEDGNSDQIMFGIMNGSQQKVSITFTTILGYEASYYNRWSLPYDKLMQPRCSFDKYMRKRAKGTRYVYLTDDDCHIPSDFNVGSFLTLAGKQWLLRPTAGKPEVVTDFINR
jgi:hypothetical protein